MKFTGLQPLAGSTSKGEEMSKRLIRLIALAIALALTATGVALAVNKATVIRFGDLVLTINGGVNPTRLPKHQLVPIGFQASGSLATDDGSHPPALRKSAFDVDKDIVVDVSGIPTCRKRQLVAQSTAGAKRACPGSILGQGRATVEVAYPEQKPFDAGGPLVLFNGGERNGVTTLYLQTYVAVPAPTAVVVTAKLTREHRGPYGLRIESTIPVIAGGSGSITGFELRANRYTEYKGKRRSFLFARCADGRFEAKGIGEFSDGLRMSGSLVRTCVATD